MNKNPSKREMQIKKLVSCAKSILTNQTTIQLGSRKISNLISWINSSQQIRELDLNIILELDEKLAKYPIGTERLYWDKKALLKEDIKIEKIVKNYREQIIDKCYEIIRILDQKQNNN